MGIEIKYINKEEFDRDAIYLKPCKALDELHEEILRHRERYDSQNLS